MKVRENRQRLQQQQQQQRITDDEEKFKSKKITSFCILTLIYKLEEEKMGECCMRKNYINIIHNQISPIHFKIQQKNSENELEFIVRLHDMSNLSVCHAYAYCISLYLFRILFCSMNECIYFIISSHAY